MPKINVMNIISDTNIGGAGMCIITFLKNYNRDKFDVSVVIPKESMLKEKVEKLDTRIIEIEGLKDKSFDIKAIREIIKIIKREKPDIVHTHASLSARIAAKICGNVKIIYTKHCDFEVGDIYDFWIIKKLNKVFNESLTNRIIATSQNAKRNLIKQGIDEDKITVVLNGVDGYKRIEDKEDIKKIRDRYNIKEEDIVVGYLARLEKLKGYDYFISAAKKINNEYGDKYKFLAVGSGSYEEEMRKKVKELNLDNVFILTGFISDVESILNIFDVQINASYLSETTSLALIEGMSIGIPSVATKVRRNSRYDYNRRKWCFN